MAVRKPPARKPAPKPAPRRAAPPKRPAPAPPKIAAPNQQQQIDDFVHRNYGYLGAFLENPEIGPILRQAATEGWDQARLQGAVFNTNWWKTTAASVRNFTALQSQDPAQAKAQVDQMAANVTAQAGKMGANIAPDRLQAIATDAVRFGWDATQLQQALAGELKFSPDQPLTGTAGVTSQQIHQMAADYMVPIADDTAFGFVKGIASGNQDINTVQSYLAGMAKSRFAGNKQMQDLIDQGMTPKQFFEPYRQQAAQLLEVAPDSIDFTNNPQWSKVVNSTFGAGADAAQRPMTLSEMQTYVRGMDGYKKTNQANQEAATFTENLLKTWGAVA